MQSLTSLFSICTYTLPLLRLLFCLSRNTIRATTIMAKRVGPPATPKTLIGKVDEEEGTRDFAMI